MQDYFFFVPQTLLWLLHSTTLYCVTWDVAEKDKQQGEQITCMPRRLQTILGRGAGSWWVGRSGSGQDSVKAKQAIWLDPIFIFCQIII